jgi:transcriptional repressor NrdR
MKCPFCLKGSSKVIDTREVGDGIRRRRECLNCRQRFTTYERLVSVNLLVVKCDGRREEFDREKLSAGIYKACAKRPVSVEAIDQLIHEVEAELYRLGKAEVPSQVIGELVVERLRRLDDVGYVRFASVYRDFRDVDTWAEEIAALKERKQREEELKRQMRLAI